MPASGCSSAAGAAGPASTAAADRTAASSAWRRTIDAFGMTGAPAGRGRRGMCKRRASGGAARTARQALAARARDVVHLSARRVPGCCLAGDAQLLARVLLYRVQAFAPGDESMPVNLDAYLGVHQDALRLYGRRTAVLANNL